MKQHKIEISIDSELWEAYRYWVEEYLKIPVELDMMRSLIEGIFSTITDSPFSREFEIPPDLELSSRLKSLSQEWQDQVQSETFVKSISTY